MWNMCSESSLIGNSPYLSGFHIYRNKRDAIKIFEKYGYFQYRCRVFKVKYYGVLAEGIQDGVKVVVASMLKLVEPVT